MTRDAVLQRLTGLWVAALLHGCGGGGGELGGVDTGGTGSFAVGPITGFGCLAEADLVITAEGCIDGQTAVGKMPAWVAQRAKRRGLPVIALAGRLGAGADRVRACGVDVLMGIAPGPCSHAEALANTARWLSLAGENVMRTIGVGEWLARDSAEKETRPNRGSSRANRRRETQETPEKPFRCA